MRAGWLKAIVAGHERIAAGIDVGMPVCMLLSARSEFGLSWNDAMLRAGFGGLVLCARSGERALWEALFHEIAGLLSPAPAPGL